VVNEPSPLLWTTVPAKSSGRQGSQGDVGPYARQSQGCQAHEDGVIADFKVTEKMLNYFIQKAHQRRNSCISHRDQRPFRDHAGRKACRDRCGLPSQGCEVHLVEQAMMAAIGAGLPVTAPGGNMVVDIGGGTTDVAVISLSGIVYSHSLRIAGNHMDEAITNYLKRKYNLLIGERTAEQIKIEIGSAYTLDKR